MIIRDNFAIDIHKSDSGIFLQFLTKTSGDWTVICGTGLIGRASLYELEMVPKSEDPMIKVRNKMYAAGKAPTGDIEAYTFFDSVEVDEQNSSIVLNKRFVNQQLNQTYTLTEYGVHSVMDLDVIGVLEIEELTNNVYFMPEAKHDRMVEPLDFAWLPNLHRQADNVCGDHFFRSPAVVAAFDGYYAALVPDIDIFKKFRNDTPQALDFRIIETGIEAPRLTYGVCPWTVDGHVYTRHTKGMTYVARNQKIRYGFDLIYGAGADYRKVPQIVSGFLWDRYGHQYLNDPRPQIMPFGEYGLKYTYKYEVPTVLEKVTVNGENCAGLNNVDRRGANFHAWENNLHIGFGIKHYGRKWRRDDLTGAANGIVNLFNQSPRNQGAFRCIYNFNLERYEGTLYWTGRVADSMTCYDSAAMGVSTWWSLQHMRHFGEDAKTMDHAVLYGRFLKNMQLKNGAVPTYFFADMSPARQLMESATTAISGAVLAKLTTVTGTDEFHDAAIEAGKWVIENTIKDLNFNDFELFYSCCHKSLSPHDMWSGIRPQNTLSLYWSCDQMLALYQLTGEDEYLDYGKYLLAILSMYQQVWDPVFYPEEYLFGGFCSQNTDGEWTDGRQCRFVSTFADYYETTGNIQYLERAVAACRAGFTLMDMKENHDNGINNLVAHDGCFFPNGAGKKTAQPGQGYAPECIHHGLDYDPNGLRVAGWSGLNWSSGGALAASAYMEILFGNVFVDPRNQTVTPIDGLRVDNLRFEKSTVDFSLSSSLKNLKAPYLDPREIIITIGERTEPVTLAVNGREYEIPAGDGKESVTLEV